nr:cytochrome c3 family protein [uncultured Desulfuromonas sp.]
MKVKQWFSFFVVLCSILLLTACGSNSGSGGDQSAAPAEDDLGSDTETGIQYVGTATCIGCHEDFSWSAEIVEEYLQGKHVIHSDHISQANAADGCLDCHDPVGDGPGLAGLIDPANVPESGLAAVGCENCHGAGGEHYGVGPIPMAEPGIEQCAACHDQLPDSHLTHHPEALFIGSNYVESRHFTASVRNEALCAKCHTDLGGRLYKDVTTKTQLEASVLPVASDEPVQCRTCHNPHNAGGLLMEEMEDHGTVVGSAEYATCLTCHMSDRDDPSNEEWMYHADRYYRLITDTHYDDPTTTEIEGYVVNKLSERSCRDCHDVHTVMEISASSGTTTINDQWAASPHAGHLSEAKAAAGQTQVNRTVEQTVAIKTAGSESEALAGHYNFSYPEGDATGNYGRVCERCHTSTGAKNYLTNPAAYDRTANDLSYLEAGQREMIYCWACHSDNSGNLRNPGYVTLLDVNDSVGNFFAGVDPVEKIVTYLGETVEIPDQGASNVCLACHGGGGNMDSAPSARFVGHHAPAGGSLFSGYVHMGHEYPGLNYAFDYFSEHGHGTIENPCVSCHMVDGETKNHTFAIISEDELGNVTLPTKGVCNTCHIPDSSYEVTVDMLEEEKSGYEESGELLGEVLANAAGYANYLGVTVNSTNATTMADNAYYAYQNRLYVEEEKGGYAHNRFYVKRLVFDSIDVMLDGSMDGSIAFTPQMMSDYPEACHWLGMDEATGTAARP